MLGLECCRSIQAEHCNCWLESTNNRFSNLIASTVYRLQQLMTSNVYRILTVDGIGYLSKFNLFPRSASKFSKPLVIHFRSYQEENLIFNQLRLLFLTTLVALLVALLVFIRFSYCPLPNCLQEKPRLKKMLPTLFFFWLSKNKVKIAREYIIGLEVVTYKRINK